MMALIYVLMTIIVMLILISKYIKFKQLNLLLVAIALFGLASPYIPDTIIFLTILITNFSLSDETYMNLLINLVIIMTLLSTLSVVCWLYAITDLMGISNQKFILMIASFCLGIFITLFLIF